MNLGSTIKVAGGLFPPQLIERIAGGDPTLKGTAPAAYHVDSTNELNQTINRAWAALTGRWASFKAQLERLPDTDRATTLTRDKWLLPLFQELGFGRLATARAIEAGDRTFALSHGWQEIVPIHLVGWRLDLDKRVAGERGAAASAPHGLVQDCLNTDEARLWAFLSNGRELRLLRDHRSLTRQAYVSFDLEAMFDGEQFGAFRLLWLLCHQSRVEGAVPAEFWLERWVTHAKDEGVRALDRLRVGVEEAITRLGCGFRNHRGNEALNARLASGALDRQEYYRQLLKLVYRLIFLFVAEDREMLLLPDPEGATDAQKNELAAARSRFRRLYATKRLRSLAMKRRGGPHDDGWAALVLVMRQLDRGNPALALPALGSFLWSTDPVDPEVPNGKRISRAIPDLDTASIANEYLYAALSALCAVQDGPVRRPVDWSGVQADELGSVYEALMERVPRLGSPPLSFALDSAAGNERKTTGSYYTPSSLVDCLLDSALDPVLDEAAKAKYPEKAILELSVVDPACGSGHFLVAAARRIAHRLAVVRCGGIEPSPPDVQHALRDVVGRCIYGVDLNPMAVELCKVSLWMEAIEPGRPLSFLDGHIRHGNALLGATPELMDRGIPDEAWDPIEGDDKETAKRLKKDNKNWKQTVLFAPRGPGSIEALATLAVQVDESDDATRAAVDAKEAAWRSLGAATEGPWLLADLWCAAFVWPKQPGEAERAAPVRRMWEGVRADAAKVPAATRRITQDIAERYRFFHWHLAFPKVFGRGGFDVVLGNPPWDSILFREEEFFATSRPEIAQAPTAAKRKKLIAALAESDPTLFASYSRELRAVGGVNAFVRSPTTYPLCGVGRVNLFALFAEKARGLMRDSGRVGQILPSGIVTDDSTKMFFQAVVDAAQLVFFYDFENREGIFEAVHRSFKFGLLTLAGSKRNRAATFVFFALDVSDVTEAHRRFTLSGADIGLLNPATRTCPIFRSNRDAEITKGVYRRLPVLTEAGWGLTLRRLLNSADDSGDFLDAPGPGRLPLYEGKSFHQFDHRWLTAEGGAERGLTDAEYAAADRLIVPRHWFPEADAVARFGGDWPHSWALAWRDIARSTDERTFIASPVPSLAIPHTAKVAFASEARVPLFPSLIANVGAFAFDFIARQKLGGTHMSGFIVEQLPFFRPEFYDHPAPWSAPETLRGWIHRRVLELTYTAWDLEPFAKDVGYVGPPFRWNPARRFLLRAELDAAFFHLYGLSRDEVDYILDTFPIVRKHDEKAHDEYRTKRVILEIYDAMADAGRTAVPYATRLDPPPADARVAHPPRDGEAAQ